MNRFDHLLAGGVLAHDHLEAELLQRVREILGVVRGIAQRRGGVLVVADEEGYALARSGKAGGACTGDRDPRRGPANPRDSPLHPKLTAHSGDNLVWGGLVPDLSIQEASDAFAAYHDENFVARTLHDYLDESLQNLPSHRGLHPRRSH